MREASVFKERYGDNAEKIVQILGATEGQVLRQKAMAKLGTTEDEVDMDRASRLSQAGTESVALLSGAPPGESSELPVIGCLACLRRDPGHAHEELPPLDDVDGSSADASTGAGTGDAADRGAALSVVAPPAASRDFDDTSLEDAR